MFLLLFALSSCAHIVPINSINSMNENKAEVKAEVETEVEVKIDKVETVVELDIAEVEQDKVEKLKVEVYGAEVAKAEVDNIEIHDTPKTISEAVSSPFRTPSFKKRDIYRNPVDTLTFFRIKPNMKVMEVTPLTPWYSEILAPFLNDQGQYIMANSSGYDSAIKSEDFLNWASKHPYIAKNVHRIDFDLSNPNMTLGEDSSIDAVLTFRNIYHWIQAKKEELAFEAMFKVLKRGGILGVVEHRAPQDSLESKITAGYIKEIEVIRLARKAGFRYFGKSEVNGNPKDTKDYGKGVWSLPPNLINKKRDRDMYIEIGESDRMTLKFVKP